MEGEKSYRFWLDMSRLRKEEVKVGIKDGTLVTIGKQSEESQKDNQMSRRHGSYNARIIFPDNFHLEETKEEIKNEVFQFVLPKVEEAKRQSLIDVKVQ
jgi:HSP20 family molecular chaperone IbpA